MIGVSGRLSIQVGSVAAVIALAIPATSVTAQDGTAAETVSQEPGIGPASKAAIGFILAHSGKVMQLASGERFVLYLPLETLFALDEEDQIITVAKVSVGDGGSMVLHWLGGGVESIDPTDLSDIQLLDEAPAFTRIMDDQILGKHLGMPVAHIPVGTELAVGGVVFSKAGERLGVWDLRNNHVIVSPLEGKPERIELAELVEAASVKPAANSTSIGSSGE